MSLDSAAEVDVGPSPSSKEEPSDNNSNMPTDPLETMPEASSSDPRAPLPEESARNSVEPMDEESLLKDLTEGMRNQEDIQRDITAQANLALIEQEDERDQKRIERATTNRDRLLNRKRNETRRLDMITTTSTQKKAIREEINRIDEQVAGLNNDILQTEERIQLRHIENDESAQNDADNAPSNRRMPNESQRDFLIRTGKITPFSRMATRPTELPEGELTNALMEAEEEAELPQDIDLQSIEPRSHQFLRKPGFADVDSSPSDETGEPSRPRKKRRVGAGSAVTSAETSDGEFSLASAKARKTPIDLDSAYTPDVTDGDVEFDLDEDEDDGIIDSLPIKKKGAKAKAKIEMETVVDDGNEVEYQKRVRDWEFRRSKARHIKLGDADIQNDEPECFKRSPDAPDHILANGLKLPGDIYPALYDYQKTGVQWLGELYHSQVGGIVGDEMGLGKTYVFSS